MGRGQGRNCAAGAGSSWTLTPLARIPDIPPASEGGVEQKRAQSKGWRLSGQAACPYPSPSRRNNVCPKLWAGRNTELGPAETFRGSCGEPGLRHHLPSVFFCLLDPELLKPPPPPLLLHPSPRHIPPSFIMLGTTHLAMGGFRGAPPPARLPPHLG